MNITTVAEWKANQVTFIDNLDLDVIQDRTGLVKLVDEDEFEDNIKTLSYPKETIRRARQYANEIESCLQKSIEPFDRSVLAWKDALDRTGVRLC